jgi:hypothetical protein
MKRLGLLAMVLALVLSGTAAWADGEYYVVGGGGGVGTKITSLPCTISAAGFYYLGSNFTYTGVNPAISVIVDGVTLDLMGFSLTGNGSNKGIYMSGRKNVEIRNGSLKNFSYGLQEDSDAGVRHRVINIRVEGNNTYLLDSYGIKLNGNGHQVKGCSAWGSNTGIRITNGTVNGCHLEGCKFGISIGNSGNAIGNSVWLAGSQVGITGGNVMLDQNTVAGTGAGNINYDIFGTAAWGTNGGH